ncbi:hypothetical protein [Bradyrhizobium sp. CCGUVB4N]|uniref:hypothetical protein n=1 Tax=Bradyrhizobium sp. CCGUVB4N TaxID=2949631 RepID=UPI0028120AA2|nr:hypothetical protein [Bradyrhizobium sp. CCGUVB4N]
MTLRSGTIARPRRYAVHEYADRRLVVRRAAIGAVPLSVDGPRGVICVKKSKPQAAKAA